MSTRWTCANGHTWQIDAPDDSPGQQELCPTCGSPGIRVVSEPSPTLTRVPPPGPSDPTLSLFPENKTRQQPNTVSGPPSSGALERVTVPGYELLEELGRGGMGVVYCARQRGLNRIVALKMILAGAHASDADLRRFMTEAEAVARVRHPNVVQIHEFGECDGVPFFALEFCSGGSLETKLASGPLPPLEAAELLEKLAGAMQAVHDEGLLHRDLKPANILLLSDGTPKITDFGLAKKVEDHGQTRTGNVLGTPAYMAPEQAAGRRVVGPAADIYALGAILYQCLTGRPPFQGASPLEVLSLVLLEEPVRPSRLQVGIPPDLETICLKCLNKEPRRRYESAGALAEDLRRFREGEPIRARPAGRLERSIKWARKRPALASLLTLAVLGPVGLSLVVMGYNVSLQHERDLALEERCQADIERDRALRAQTEAEKARRDAETARTQAEAARRQAQATLIDLATTAGLTAAEQKLPAQAVLWFAHAAGLARDYPERERANRLRVQTWLWETPRPVRAFQSEGQPLILSFHPDGGHLLVFTRQGRAWLWDIRAEKTVDWPRLRQLASAAVWSPSGRWLAVAAPSNQVDLLGFPDGQRLHRLDLPGPILALAVSPDGRWLAIGTDTGVRLWDDRTSSLVEKPLPLPRGAHALSFNQAGDRLAVAGGDNQARVFALPSDTGQPLFEPVPHLFSSTQTPNRPPLLIQDRLTTITGNNEITFWDAQTGKKERTVSTSSPRRVDIAELVPAPDQRHVGVAGFPGALILDVKTGNVVGQLMQHKNSTRLAFSPRPDLDRVLTVSGDRVAQVWNAATGTALGPPIPHYTSVDAAAFSPDGYLLATAQPDGLIRLWVAAGSPPGHHIPHGGGYANLELSADGRYAFPPGAAGWTTNLRGTRLYEVATGRPVSPVISAGGLLMFAALSPDGKLMVLVDNVSGTPRDYRTGRLQFRDVRSGALRFPSLTLPTAMSCPAFSPDGRTLVVACQDGTTLLIDPATGKVRYRDYRRASGYPVAFRPVFTPDGRYFLLSGVVPTLDVRDTASGQLVRRIELGVNAAISVNARGTLVAEASHEGRARVWDLAAGKQKGQTLGHPDWVFQAVFSSDDRLLLTACRDGQVRLWDWRQGRLVCPPFRHADEVFDATFHDGDRMVLTASRDGTIRVWDARTGKPLTPSWPVGTWAWNVRVASGRWAIVAGLTRGAFAVYSLDDLARADALSIEELRTLGEIVAVQSVHEGGLVNLTTAEWLQRWRRFRQAHPDYARLDPWGQNRRDWHRHEADENVRQFRNEQALFHLNHLLRLEEKNAWALEMRGRVRLRQGQTQEAEADLIRAAELGDEAERLWLEMAERADTPARARDYLRRAMQSRDASWRSWARQASLAAREGAWDEVEQSLAEAGRREGDVVALWTRLAGTLTDSERQMWCLDQAVKAGPRDARAFTARGNQLAARRDWKRAREDLARAVALQPGNGLPRTALGLLHLALDDVPGYVRVCQAAIRDWRQVGGPLPGSLTYLLTVGPGGLTGAGDLLRQAERAAEGSQLCTRWHVLGALLFRSGQNSRALKAMARGIELCRAQGTASDLYLLALASHAAGKSEEAREWLKKATAAHQRLVPSQNPPSLTPANWPTRLALELLQKEARTRLEKP